MSRRRSAFWGGLIGGALGPTVARASRKLVRGFGKVLLFALVAFWGWLYNLTGSAKGAALMLLLLIACLVALVGLLRSNRQPHLPTLGSNAYGPDPGRTFLYRFYDEGGNLLYVGIAEDPDARERQHAADRTKAHWWWRVDHRVDVTYVTRREAKEAESAAIRGELGDPRPWFNVAEAPAEP